MDDVCEVWKIWSVCVIFKKCLKTDDDSWPIAELQGAGALAIGLLRRGRARDQEGGVAFPTGALQVWDGEERHGSGNKSPCLNHALVECKVNIYLIVPLDSFESQYKNNISAAPKQKQKKKKQVPLKPLLLCLLEIYTQTGSLSPPADWREDHSKVSAGDARVEGLWGDRQAAGERDAVGHLCQALLREQHWQSRPAPGAQRLHTQQWGSLQETAPKLTHCPLAFCVAGTASELASS